MFISIIRRGAIVGLIFVFIAPMIPNVYAEQKSETSMTVELTRKIEPGSGPGAEKIEKSSNIQIIETSQKWKDKRILPKLGAVNMDLLGGVWLLVILMFVIILKLRIDKMSKNEEK